MEMFKCVNTIWYKKDDLHSYQWEPLQRLVIFFTTWSVLHTRHRRSLGERAGFFNSSSTRGQDSPLAAGRFPIEIPGRLGSFCSPCVWGGFLRALQLPPTDSKLNNGVNVCASTCFMLAISRWPVQCESRLSPKVSSDWLGEPILV